MVVEVLFSDIEKCELCYAKTDIIFVATLKSGEKITFSYNAMKNSDTLLAIMRHKVGKILLW